MSFPSFWWPANDGWCHKVIHEELPDLDKAVRLTKGKTLAIQAGGNVANLVAGWHVTGTGDYNAGGHADVLLRSDSGQTAVWQMAANGFGIATGHNISALASDWATTAHHYDFV